MLVMPRKKRALKYGDGPGQKQTKFCRDCGTERPLADFYERSSGTNRFSYLCKEHEIAQGNAKSKAAIDNGLCGCGKPTLENRSECASCFQNRTQRLSDPETRLAYNDRNSRNRAKARQKVLDHYGHRCACCGVTQDEFLSIDHIGGWGKDHKDAKGYKMGSYRLYAWIIRNGFPENFRTLCHNCNSAHGYYGYCPHELQRAETYPGQEYFHATNPAIARAENNWRVRQVVQ